MGHGSSSDPSVKNQLQCGAMMRNFREMKGVSGDEAVSYFLVCPAVCPAVCLTVMPYCLACTPCQLIRYTPMISFEIKLDPKQMRGRTTMANLNSYGSTNLHTYIVPKSLKETYGDSITLRTVCDLKPKGQNIFSLTSSSKLYHSDLQQKQSLKYTLTLVAIRSLKPTMVICVPVATAA
jgi:hypothetical protein